MVCRPLFFVLLVSLQLAVYCRRIEDNQSQRKIYFFFFLSTQKENVPLLIPPPPHKKNLSHSLIIHINMKVTKTIFYVQKKLHIVFFSFYKSRFLYFFQFFFLSIFFIFRFFFLFFFKRSCTFVSPFDTFSSKRHSNLKLHGDFTEKLFIFSLSLKLLSCVKCKNFSILKK